jgi:putative FmdB family regulatory protein
MPIYEYRCNDCKQAFEQIVLNKSAAVTCPQCGSNKHTLQFSVVSVKGGDGSYSSGGDFGPDSGGGGGCCGPSGCGCH